jgi:hypothetical protein
MTPGACASGVGRGSRKSRLSAAAGLVPREAAAWTGAVVPRGLGLPTSAAGRQTATDPVSSRVSPAQRGARTRSEPRLSHRASREVGCRGQPELVEQHQLHGVLRGELARRRVLLAAAVPPSRIANYRADPGSQFGRPDWTMSDAATSGYEHCGRHPTSNSVRAASTGRWSSAGGAIRGWWMFRGSARRPLRPTPRPPRRRRYGGRWAQRLAG